MISFVVLILFDCVAHPTACLINVFVDVRHLNLLAGLFPLIYFPFQEDIVSLVHLLQIQPQFPTKYKYFFLMKIEVKKINIYKKQTTKQQKKLWYKKKMNRDKMSLMINHSNTG